MINKVQMFQIACTKVNQSLKRRKLQPVFNLQIDESKPAAFSGMTPALNINSPSPIKNTEGSPMLTDNGKTPGLIKGSEKSRSDLISPTKIEE